MTVDDLSVRTWLFAVEEHAAISVVGLPNPRCGGLLLRMGRHCVQSMHLAIWAHFRVRTLSGSLVAWRRSSHVTSRGGNCRSALRSCACRLVG